MLMFHLAFPVELLAYIFVLGTHDALNHADNDDHGYQQFNSESVQAPLAYAAVCRHWRSVALGTPALFTSLCITPELLRDHTLDLRGIAAYLVLSCTYPLDILIDARDPDWDFASDATYTPWFSAAHMRSAMALLLPHLARWRSLSVFTDVCAPMHAALRPLEAQLAFAGGAPRLESLRLMRCDAYAADADAPSYAFLAAVQPGLGSTARTHAPLLPRLRHLTLRGVPAAWSPLAAHLSPALRTLELAFLSAPVHPPLPALAALLRAAPRLARLVLNGAGPAPPPGPHDLPPPPHLCLSHLTALCLGYTTSAGALAALRLLAGRAAPALRALALEDASGPAALVPVDAAPLLAFVFPKLVHPRPQAQTHAAQEHEVPFPALDEIVLRRTHVSGPGPFPVFGHAQAPAPGLPAPAGVRVRRLELVGASEALLPLARAAAVEVCMRGPLAPAPGVAPRRSGGDDGWMTNVVRALVNDNPGAGPALVELHTEARAHRGVAEDVEERVLGTTRVRVVRALCAAADGGHGSDEDDGNVSMDGEGEDVFAWRTMS
ncbi:hypothetical protein GGX14DRAFT_586563 [Mycena pura]|uniref:F-box domain-containing protein n=1 Tax=Mycena pura TaxID=153505 RepID=A0AAD6YKI3_9AGAR|nr:hypothetical protein GGX14DRAFT_586563 [Mycena pura]